MKYISFADMARTVVSNLYKVSQDIDLVVGIPRSGLLAGNLIALSLNVPIIDLEGFIHNRRTRNGFTRDTKTKVSLPQEAKHVLIVDDISRSEVSSAAIKNDIISTAIKQKITFCTIYTYQYHAGKADIYFQKLSSPTIFEWNIMNSNSLENCCIDIDGVLCRDPIPSENDDGPAYLRFLKNAKPLSLPSSRVGYLVTNRLEKYRPQTEEWLKRNHILYKQLHMLDLPDSNMRRQLNNYAGFKAQVYKSYLQSPLFIESDLKQALEITKASGKTVLCFADKKLYDSDVIKSLFYNGQANTLSLIFNNIKIVASRLLHSGHQIKKPVRNLFS
ncbi:MAG: hypothetical protein WD491_07990 [Balneolales bacterium]